MSTVGVFLKVLRNNNGSKDIVVKVIESLVLSASLGSAVAHLSLALPEM